MVLSRLRGRFAFDDVAQQFVGATIIGGPFVVTEEVWTLGSKLDVFNLILISLFVLVIGYAILYKADTTRDPDREGQVAGIPLRYISLLLVSLLSTSLLAGALGAPTAFADVNGVVPIMSVTLQTSLVISPFSVIGSAISDSLF